MTINVNPPNDFQLMDSRPLILISNDDGIAAKGIRFLIDCVAPLGDVIVVAPMTPQSGKASAITVEGVLRIIPRPDYAGAKMFMVNGTPVDCVKLAMHSIVPRKPDLMLSGINHGGNSSTSVVYSGTMGAAFEATMAGIPSIGYSLLDYMPDADFEGCREYVDKITRAVLAHGLPQDVCINVNIPARCTPKGMKVVRSARGHWSDEYKEYKDPAGYPFYMLAGHFVNDEPDKDDTDLYWLDRDYMSVVPVTPHPTAPDLSKIKEILG